MQGVYIRKRNLIYFGTFLRQLVTDSRLLLMSEKVLHCNCSRVLCKGNVFGQNGCSCKRKCFGNFIEQENVWLVLEPAQKAREELSS